MGLSATPAEPRLVSGAAAPLPVALALAAACPFFPVSAPPSLHAASAAAAHRNSAEHEVETVMVNYDTAPLARFRR